MPCYGRTIFAPACIVFAKGCLYVYGKPTKDEKLSVVVVPRHFSTDVACIQTYGDSAVLYGHETDQFWLASSLKLSRDN